MRLDATQLRVRARVMALVASVSREICVNVLSQYRPVHEAERFPVVARTVRGEEVAEAVDAARAAGLGSILVDGRPWENAQVAASPQRTLLE